MQVTCPDGVYLPALGRNVDAGESIDVPDDVGASLVEQGWKSKKAAPAAKPATAEKED